jgi:Phytanoyl-CoA dioxygenase (PhyH)
MWTNIEQITEGRVLRSDIASWKKWSETGVLHSMLLQFHSAGQAQYIWDIRSNPKVANVFAQIWKVKADQLITSMDGVSYHLPPEETGKGWFRHHWFHSDQSFGNSKKESVQSWVTGYDVTDQDATLMAVIGSHLKHSEFSPVIKAKMQKNAKDEADFKKRFRGNFTVLDDDDIQWFTERGCKPLAIACPAGSIVLWDSRVIHYGREPLKTRKLARLRNVAYVCMTPRAWCKPKDLAKRVKIFEDMRLTRHLPHHPTVFADKPRTYGKVLPTFGKPSKPVLSALGRRLVGY